MGLHPVAYDLLVVVHIGAYSLYIGGWFMGGLWKAAADSLEDPGSVARAHERLAKAESWILVPLGLVGFFGGYMARRLPIGAPFMGQRITDATWTTLGMLLWFAGLAVWWFGMRRLEDTMIVDAEEAAEDGTDLGEEHARNSVKWFALDALAVLFPLLGVVVMVVRPA
jgi:uncharacterized membrane protein